MKRGTENAIQIPISKKQPGVERVGLNKFIALLRKTEVEKPKQGDMNALRIMLENTPGLWRAVGDLAQYSMRVVIAGRWLSPSMRVSIDVGIRDIKQDMGYEDAPALEKMLIDQVIVSWLQLQKTQVNYESVMRNGTSIPNAGYWERRLSASHMRYLRACETLARVRKLSRPSAMQVNIGARQVNVAQAAKRGDEDSGEQIKSVNVDGLSSSSES